MAAMSLAEHAAVAKSTQRTGLLDKLSMKSAQLNAALAMAWGEGFEAFNALQPTEKENYLGLCFELSQEVRELTNELALLA